MSNNNDMQERIAKAKENQKSRKTLRQSIKMLGLTTALLLTKYKADAQEIKTQDPKTNNIEHTHAALQKNDHICSKAEKLFDMYRLAYFDDTLYNTVSPTEKDKCKEFFNQYPDAKDMCDETQEYVKTNRGLRDFNTAEKTATNNGNQNLRSNFLTYLANNPKASEAMDKIQSSEYAKESVNELTSYEKDAAQIWSMYTEVETGNASNSYKEFFKEYPGCATLCRTAANKAGISKDQLANTTIADVNAGMYYNKETIGSTGSTSLTEEMSRLLEHCDKDLGIKIKVPQSASTYQVTARDFQQTR